jgi:hypothetical protein
MFKKLLIVHVDGVRLHLRFVATNGPIIHHQRTESHGAMILTVGSQRTWRKPCPSATLSTTNQICNEPGANTGLRFERLATN